MIDHCSDCQKPLANDKRRKGTRCKPCLIAERQRASADREAIINCSDCGADLKPSRQRKGTRCKPCTARHCSRDAEARAKISAASKRNWADPKLRAARVASMTAANRRPEIVERARQRGKIHNNVARFAKPLPAGHPLRVQAGKTLTERRIGWCPPCYREAYHSLKQNDGFRAAEARSIIEAQIDRDLAAMRKGTLPPGEFMAARETLRWLNEFRQSRSIQDNGRI